MISEYDTQTFEECASALKLVREQYISGKELTWTGPNRLHYSISATCPEPSWFFSDEGRSCMEENDYDFWDIYTMIAFHLGWHNGTITALERGY